MDQIFAILSFKQYVVLGPYRGGHHPGTPRTTGLLMCHLIKLAWRLKTDLKWKLSQSRGDINIVMLDSTTLFYSLFHHHLNYVYGSNFCNFKFQTTCCFGSLQRRAPPKLTANHKVPHVPPNEIGLEAHNRFEVKVEPKSGRYQHYDVGFYNSHLLLVSSPSHLCLWIKFLQFQFSNVVLGPCRGGHHPGSSRTTSLLMCHPMKLAWRLRTDLKWKFSQNQDDINIVRLDSTTPIYSLFYHHLNCVYGSNLCNFNFQTTCCFGSSLQRGAPPKDTLDHKPPHVSPDEIDLEAQNQSEVKVEPRRKIALQVQNKSEVKFEPKPRPYKSSAVGFHNSHPLLVSSPSQLYFWIKFLQF
jgi:hypothetical protein